MAGTMIIGGGHAGGAAAVALRRHGYNGPITILGEESHRPYERPLLSKGFLLNAKQTPPPVTTEWSNLSIDLRLGVKAMKILRDQQQVMCSSRERHSFDHLILAMGGAPKQLPYAALQRLHYLRDIRDANRLRIAFTTSKRLVVIGAGVIGLEVAATGRMMGLDVVVLEAADRILSRNIAPDLAADIAALHAAHGVDVYCRAKIVNIQETETEIRFVLESGEEVAGEVAVAGIGIAPATKLAETADLACDNGVLVNDKQQTEDPRIYAIGDLAAIRQSSDRPLRLETWANANESAEIAAVAICGAEPPPRRAPWFWTDQYDINIQVVGDTLSADNMIRRSGDASSTRLYFKKDALAGAATMDNGKDMGALRRMLDAGMSPSRKEAANEELSMRDLLKACKQHSRFASARRQ